MTTNIDRGEDGVVHFERLSPDPSTSDCPLYHPTPVTCRPYQSLDIRTNYDNAGDNSYIPSLDMSEVPLLFGALEGWEESDHFIPYSQDANDGVVNLPTQHQQSSVVSDSSMELSSKPETFSCTERTPLPIPQNKRSIFSSSDHRQIEVQTCRKRPRRLSSSSLIHHRMTGSPISQSSSSSFHRTGFFQPSSTLCPHNFDTNALKYPLMEVWAEPDAMPLSPIMWCEDVETEFDKKLVEELDNTKGVEATDAIGFCDSVLSSLFPYVSEDDEISGVESRDRSPSPVPFLTPPQSPLTIHTEEGPVTVCEWPSNLAVDSAIRAANDLTPFTPNSLQQFAEDEAQRPETAAVSKSIFVN